MSQGNNRPFFRTSLRQDKFLKHVDRVLRLYMQIKALHQYDCLRANKATSAWGLEARVPFLDKEFINVAMSIDPESKMVRN